MTSPDRDRRRRSLRPTGMVLKVLAVLLVLGAVGAAVAVAMQGRGPNDDTGGRTLDEAAVERMSFDIATTATGELESQNQIEVRNPLDSRTTITYITPEGQHVEKGAELVRLNAEELETQIAEQEIQVASAQSDLEAAESEYQIQIKTNESELQAAELQLQLAELSLSQWEQGELPQKRQDNLLALEEAARQLERSEDRYEKTVELHSEGYESADKLKEDEIALLRARAEVDKAELAKRIYEEFQRPKDEAQKRSDVDKARDELDRVRDQNEIRINTKRTAVDNRRQQFQVRQTRLAKLVEQFEASTIEAPAAGLVVYQTSLDRGWRGDGPLQVGTEVYPNQLLIVLPDTSQMQATVRVHESLAGRLREGQPASVRIDAVAGLEIPGVVSGIGVLAESGGWRDPNLREYRVNIALDQSAVDRQSGGTSLRPSMRCEARIILGRVDDALAVPVQAIYNDGMLRYAYVREGSLVVRRPVQIGRRSDTHAEITAGLESGEHVLLREPEPGEVLNRPWAATELAAVGLKLDEQGNVVRDTTAAAPAGGGQGRREGGSPRAARNNG